MNVTKEMHHVLC